MIDPSYNPKVSGFDDLGMTLKQKSTFLTNRTFKVAHCSKRSKGVTSDAFDWSLVKCMYVQIFFKQISFVSPFPPFLLKCVCLRTEIQSLSSESNLLALYYEVYRPTSQTSRTKCHCKRCNHSPEEREESRDQG